MGPRGGPTAAVTVWEAADDSKPPGEQRPLAEDSAPPGLESKREARVPRFKCATVSTLHTQRSSDADSQPPEDDPSSRPWLVKLMIMSATGLRRTDWGPGQSADPYCIVGVPGKPGLSYRTHIIHSTVVPVWRHECLLNGWSEGDALEFVVMDHDRFTKDDFLGQATLQSEDFLADGFEGALPLQLNGAATSAELHISVQVVRQCARFKMRSIWESWDEHHADTSTSWDTTKPEHSMQRGMDSIRTQRGPELQQLGSPCMLDPSCMVRLFWDVIGIIVLSLDLMWLPMQVFNLPESDVMLALQWWSVCYWTLDIFMSCNTGTHSKEGFVVMDRGAVIRLYMRRWLVLDLLVVCMEWSFLVGLEDTGLATEAASAARAGKVFRLVRVFRMLRLMRLVKMRELLFTLQSWIESEFAVLAMMVFTQLMTILALNHVLACLWFAVGNISQDGWVATAGLMDGDVVTNYLIAMQWSMAQFTPGSSTIHPLTVHERLYSLGVLVLGFVVATCFVSNITSTLSAVWSMKRNDRTQSLLLKKFLRQNCISRTLASRVTRYIHCVRELRQRKVHPSHVQFLTFLSGPLNVELLCELRGPQICSHHFFPDYKAASKYAFRELCTAALEHCSFARNDVLFIHGSEARHMYFISNGSAVYRHRPSVPIGATDGSAVLPRSRLEAGQWCCEIALWVPWQHVGDMKALSDVDATILNVAKFGEVTCSDPHAYNLARDHGRRFIEQAEQIASFDRHALTDLPLRISIVGGSHHALLPPSESRGAPNPALRELKEAELMQMELVEFSDSGDEVHKRDSRNRSAILQACTANGRHGKAWRDVSQMVPSLRRMVTKGIQRARTVA